jgi:hypothetical protein
MRTARSVTQCCAVLRYGCTMLRSPRSWPTVLGRDRTGQTGYIDGEARETSLDQAWDDWRPERVCASQAVDEEEGQACPACWHPRVEDLLAVDVCERHLV